MAEPLHILLFGQLAGSIERTGSNRMRLTYGSDWRHARTAVPLSISMPLAAAVHEGRVVEAWLWGLLPDNEFILERWARRHQVSPRNPLALLAHVGEDCPGAVQIVRPERLEAVSGAGPGEIRWLTRADVADRLRALERDRSAWRTPDDIGQFSLAGAQPKTALFFDGEKWGLPSGRMPTTHILKPPMADLDGHAENEHFCLSLARAAGLPAALSWVGHFEDKIAIVVERFDRIKTSDMAARYAAQSAAYAAEAAANSHAPGARARAAAAAAKASASAQNLNALAKTVPFLRLHQEDMCQALGRYPWEKYQNEGGLSPEDIVLLLRRHSSRPDDDIGTFLDSLLFNWIIGGTDGHAKNYALLLAGRGQVRLAPLYDIASILPYRDNPLQRATLAMKIGSKYCIEEIAARHWLRLYETVRVDADAFLSRHEELAHRIKSASRLVAERLAGAGLDNPIVYTLGARIEARAEACAGWLGA